jgi:DNA-binding beta-propeller fold protein YncE
MNQGGKGMKMKQAQKVRGLLLLALIIGLTGLSNQIKADTGNCGGVTITLPFNDVMASPFFCQIAAAYFSGLTNGTGDGTTYSPTQTVTREQMAAFISRTMDQSLKRGSQRAVAKKWFTPQTTNSLTLTDIGINPTAVEFDGTDLWVANRGSGSVSRIRPSDGKVLETWTGAESPSAILAAFGRIYVTDDGNFDGEVYVIDPKQPAGAMTLFADNLAWDPVSITTDGTFIWTASTGVPEQSLPAVSRIDIQTGAVTTFMNDFTPTGILYDGASIWVASAPNSLKRLNQDGTVAQSLNIGNSQGFPIFDGTNIWVPRQIADSMIVVRVKDANGAPLANAFVLATLTGNGMNRPTTPAFDGERILVTNNLGNSVSMWKASDLTPLGSFPTGASTSPLGACSDGLNFWITLVGPDKLARF